MHRGRAADDADGPDAGTIVDVPKGELTMGRAPSCNVVVASGLVSKVHARVQRTSNQLVLQDLQSINGTFVNGARVESVAVLNDGDTINFAGVRASECRSMARPLRSRPASPRPAPTSPRSTRMENALRLGPGGARAIEQARAEAMQLAALRAPAAAPAAGEKKPAPAAARPAAPKPPVAAKAGEVAAVLRGTEALAARRAESRGRATAAQSRRSAESRAAGGCRESGAWRPAGSSRRTK